jgi:voltage-gated potassium channel
MKHFYTIDSYDLLLSMGKTKRRDWKQTLNHTLFETENKITAFEIILIIFIMVSSLAVILESIPSVESSYGPALLAAEWFFTIVFTVEYILRIATASSKRSYLFSFYGAVDFISIIPMYLSFIIGGPHPFLIIRLFRLLRLFRIFKLSKYVIEAENILKALKASKTKLVVFVFMVLSVLVMMGALMYLVEGRYHGFTNIPKSIYWAVETMTTVGFGDIVPITPVGQAIAAVLMLLSYVVIAVFTGILSAELTRIQFEHRAGRFCTHCNTKTHDADAAYCRKCGKKI